MVKRGPQMRPQAQKEKRSMDYFAGLDVSVKETSVCIVDDAGKIVWEARVASESEALLQMLTNNRLARVELEAGPLSQWLYSVLAEAGLPVICVETRHMRAVLKARINKTDRNDARGIAQMMRVGLYRPVHVKTLRSQKLRVLLTHRKLLQSKAIAIEQRPACQLAQLRPQGGHGGDGEVRGADQRACRKPSRFGCAGRAAAHCPTGRSRAARHPASPRAGHRPGR